MAYENFTVEQRNRADALIAAATSHGSPAPVTAEDLVRAAHYILIGEHEALPAPVQYVDGGGVTPATQ